MELRLITSSDKQKEFGLNLAESRLTRGMGFTETESSSVGAVHLNFGRLLALFNEDSAHPDEMLGGAIFHDLACFPQSYPRPDLTYLSLDSVIECGELWSKLAGGAALIRQGTWILAGILGVKAILIYPICDPWNLTVPYVRDFEKVGEPVEWPYARGLSGERILVQPMVSQAEKLQKMVEEAQQWGFEANGDLTLIRFNSPHPLFRGLRERVHRASSPGRQIFRNQTEGWHQQDSEFSIGRNRETDLTLKPRSKQ